MASKRGEEEEDRETEKGVEIDRRKEIEEENVKNRGEVKWRCGQRGKRTGRTAERQMGKDEGNEKRGWGQVLVSEKKSKECSYKRTCTYLRLYATNDYISMRVLTRLYLPYIGWCITGSCTFTSSVFGSNLPPANTQLHGQTQMLEVEWETEHKKISELYYSHHRGKLD